MKWNKYTLKTTAAAEDIVASALADAGVEGVEIEDNTPLTEEELKGMFVDIPLAKGEDDGTARLNFYLDPEEDNEEILGRIRNGLDALRAFTDIGEGTITASETEDKDWINNWKDYFHSFRVGNIFIVPSWEDDTPLPTDEMVIHIDPGTAFGTGLHETTQLCIRQLKKRLKKGDRMLDVGTGSGILGIVAVKLGASYVLGTDLDPCAVNAVSDNKKANDIEEGSLELIIGNLIDDEDVQKQCGDDYDIITANILPDVLVPLTPEAVRHLKPGGIYITSGILDVKEDVVTEAVRAAGLNVIEVSHQGEWVSVTAEKPADN